MSDDLITWLRAQLDEDERVTLAVADHRGRAGELRWQQCDPERQPGLIGDDVGNVVTFGIELPLAAHAEHIALHDPARVLREVEAKQRILDEHPARTVMAMSGDGYGYPGVYCGCCSPGDPNMRQWYPCRTLRLLALPYADRPGYREDWRP